MKTMLELGQAAKAAAAVLRGAGTRQKNEALFAIADALRRQQAQVLAANEQDLAAAEENGVRRTMLDRLRLTGQRLDAMAESVLQVAALPDPVGRVLDGWQRPNGLKIRKVRVPIGVVGIIYEARPNVTVDAAALCLKSGNAVILRGGKEAIHSNRALAQLMRGALAQSGFCEDAIQLVENPDRAAAAEMMRLNGYIDVLIPRGSAGLIRATVENATVPVIETGAGNCHVYIDRAADLEKAVAIADNAKTSRPSVCNAAETLLVHREIAERFLPLLAQKLAEHQVQLRGCGETRRILGGAVRPATEEDYATEFNDYIYAVRVVDSLEEAIRHIGRYTTGHSEAIVTEDYSAAQRFLTQVDAAAVYVNASTRFTDGGEFGLGAEIGISTQKLHARGPMGLEELTSTKYLVEGDGQIR